MVRVIKHTVPWVLLAVIGLSVFNAFNRYEQASQMAAVNRIPPSLQTTAPADADKAPKKTVVIRYDGLNFRKQPSSAADSLAVLDKGAKLQWLETKNGWYKVKTKDGKIGWVSASKQYTKVVKGR